MTDRDKSSGFLERWSRRKAEAGRETPAAPEAAADRVPDSQQVAPPAAAAMPKPLETPEFDLSSLPSLDSITAATDIRAFLMPGVPKDLTRAALRRAWVADPAIRDFVGLAENAWDFTDRNAMAGFGALPPDFDVKKLIAEIFGEREQPQSAGDAVATSQEPRQPDPAKEIPAPSSVVRDSAAPDPPDQATPVTAQEPQRVTLETGQTDFVQRANNIATQQTSSDDESDAESASRKPRPHGGALPH